MQQSMSWLLRPELRQPVLNWNLLMLAVLDTLALS